MNNEELHRQALDSHGYDMLAQIGSGGFASVYKVYSRVYCQEFAVKIIPVGHKQEKTLNSFDAELNSLKRLFHRNIIQLFNFFKTDIAYYLILEWCPYGTYQELIDNNGPIPIEELVPVCTQIILALQHCHDQGVVHRDLKPSNIFIDKYQRPKLADFGLASLYEEGEYMEIFVGSKAFIPPEIYSRKPYDAAKADIWSLGVTFYFLAAGKLPWEAKDSQTLEKSIFSGCFSIPSTIGITFGTILRKLIQVEPSARITTDELLKLEPFSSYLALNNGLPRLKYPKHINIINEEKHAFYKNGNALSMSSQPIRSTHILLRPSISIKEKRQGNAISTRVINRIPFWISNANEV